MRSNKINNVDLFTQTANDRNRKHVKTQSKEALEIINAKVNWSTLYSLQKMNLKDHQLVENLLVYWLQ